MRRLRRLIATLPKRVVIVSGQRLIFGYNRYNTVSHPEGPERRSVRKRFAEMGLSEVLRDCGSKSFVV